MVAGSSCSSWSLAGSAARRWRQQQQEMDYSHAQEVVQGESVHARRGGSFAILHEVSGCARVGEVTGVMGPSGSGKSTLLNVLSGQVASGGTWRVTGSVHMNGQPLDAVQLCHAAAFVAQQDTLLLRYLSVEEALRCSAALRLGPGTTPVMVSDKVEHVLHELHIGHLRAKRSHRGSLALLSGGERQRVSIGMELVSDPRLLLLDEPTSGLDSFNAREVMATLQAVASKGRIVLTSLHQPSPILFNMLNQALLIAQGHVVFSGPPKAAAAAFQMLGWPCPQDGFIADHMLEVVGNVSQMGPLLTRITQPEFKAALRQAVLGGEAVPPSSATSSGYSSGVGSTGVRVMLSDGQAAEPLYGGGLQDGPASSVPSSPGAVHVVHVPFMRRMGVLAWRIAQEAARNPMLVLLHWLFAITLGLITGFVYFKVPNNTSGAQNRVGSIFFVLNLFGSMSVTAIDLIQMERQVVERELLRRLYPWWLHMGLKLVVDGLLLRLLPGAVFTCLYYWLMGLRHTGTAFTVFLFVFCTFNCLVGALGLLCAVVMGTPGRAVLVLMSALLLSALFSGFLVNKASISWVLRWLTYISPYRFAWEALVVNELAPMTLSLDAPGLPPVPPVQGSLFLGLLGVDPHALTTNIIVVDCMYAILAAGAFAAMWLRLFLLRTGRA